MRITGNDAIQARPVWRGSRTWRLAVSSTAVSELRPVERAAVFSRAVLLETQALVAPRAP